MEIYDDENKNEKILESSDVEYKVDAKEDEKDSTYESAGGQESSFSPYKPPKKEKKAKGITAWVLVLCIVLSAVSGAAGGYISGKYTNGSRGGEGSVVMYQSVIRNVSTQSDEDEPLTYAQVSALVEDSVVEITTEKTSGNSYMPQYVTTGAGSGVILTADGYIVTNNHVIDGAEKINVTLHNGESYEATLVATDEQTDLAVIKIEAEGLSPVTIGKSSELQTGDEILVVGNPLGELGGSVSKGIISALDRQITIDGNEMTLLQTDAAVNPGNSGGGMFNMYGELVGIVNAKSSGSDVDNIGFAIPIDSATDVIEQLISFGYVQDRPRLGVTMVEITDSFTALQYRVNEYGVYILQVEDGSCADKAGIKVGDRLVSIGDVEISSADNVSSALSNFKAGDSVEITVSRDGKNLTLNAVLDEYVPNSTSNN